MQRLEVFGALGVKV